MPIDRRELLRTAAVGAAGMAMGGAAAGCATWPGAGGAGAGGFLHGVASGDPLADRVILWTRVTPAPGEAGAPIDVRWWVSRDAAGTVKVAGGLVPARPDRDYTVKIDARGLRPGTDYYYGFAASGQDSPVGRTRTLAAGGLDPVRLAFASCANFPNGYFNGYAHMARRGDLDAVLHLGDYFYEYGNGEYGDGTSLGRIPAPLHETLTLEDYRVRHATYKSDPDLQAAHARHPWITVWDDHESANNSHRRGAQNHDDASEGDWETRRLAAIRAYSEWMPIRDLPTGLFRTFRFGDLLDLVMLDTRLHGRDPAPPREEVAARDPARTLLGLDQTEWLLDALAESQGDAIPWRVIGQQVVVSPMPFGKFGFNPDAWDGYRANRARILDFIADEAIANVVFLSGDVHSSWAFEVPAEDSDERRAVEFVCPAISSPPLGAALTSRGEDLGDQLPDHVAFVDVMNQGYAVLDVAPDRVRAEYVFTQPVDRRSPRTIGGPVLESQSGTNRIRRVDGAAGGVIPLWQPRTSRPGSAVARGSGARG